MSAQSALSARQLGELLEELAPLVSGLRVLDVQALPPRDLLLVLEEVEGVRRLRLSAHPDGPRLHLRPGQRPRLQNRRGSRR